MDDIGSTDETALLCHTNEPAPRFIVGDWFDPNGNKVGNDSYSTPGDVPGLKRNRVAHVVILKRSSSEGTPPEGVYKCVVKDTTDTNQTVYVGIYSGMCLVFSKIYLAMSFLQASAVLHFFHLQCRLENLSLALAPSFCPVKLM